MIMMDDLHVKETEETYSLPLVGLSPALFVEGRRLRLQCDPAVTPAGQADNM